MGELFLVNYELRVTNYDLRITIYELRFTNYDLYSFYTFIISVTKNKLA